MSGNEDTVVTVMQSSVDTPADDVINLVHSSDLVVNPSQLEAVKLALTHRIALIQGPPGKVFNIRLAFLVKCLVHLESFASNKAHYTRPDRSDFTLRPENTITVIALDFIRNSCSFTPLHLLKIVYQFLR